MVRDTIFFVARSKSIATETLSQADGSVVEPAPEECLGRAAAVLSSHTEELVARQVEVLQAFPEYSSVPIDDMVRSSRRNVVRVIAMLRGEERLPKDIIEDERRSGARRAEQGVPAEVVAAAYRGAIGVIRDAFLEIAPAEGTPVDGILLGMRRLWMLTDHFSSTLIAAYHHADLAGARQAEQRRISFLQHALDGASQPEDLLDWGREYGFNNTSSYWVVRGFLRPEEDDAVLVELEAAATDMGLTPMLLRRAESVSGLVGRRPVLGSDRSSTLAAVGPVPLAGLADASAEAHRLLDTARRLDVCGVVTRESLSLRAVVLTDPLLGAILTDRYVHPVRLGSSMAEEILETVRSYLRSDRSVSQTAAAMSLHGNTVRYRLERYEELTGQRLAETRVVLESWWALEYDRGQRPAESLASSRRS